MSWTALPETLSGALDFGLGHAGAAGSQLLGFAATQTLAIGAVGCGLFLLSEVLARVSPIRDPRARDLAGRLGVDPGAVVPVADGVQLWRDAAAADPKGIGALADAVPPGAPTLLGSYLVRTPQGLVFVAIHDLTAPRLELVAEQPGMASLPVAVYDGFTGAMLRNRIAFSVDDDVARRIRLVEHLARALDIEMRGEVRPLVLTRGGKLPGLAPDALREGLPLVDGQTVPHLDIDDAAVIAAQLHAMRPGKLAEADADRAFNHVSRLCRTQPRRMTPRTKLLRRALVGAACLIGWMLYGPGVSTGLIEDAATAAKTLSAGLSILP